MIAEKKKQELDEINLRAQATVLTSITTSIAPPQDLFSAPSSAIALPVFRSAAVPTSSASGGMMRRSAAPARSSAVAAPPSAPRPSPAPAPAPAPAPTPVAPKPAPTPVASTSSKQPKGEKPQGRQEQEDQQEEEQAVFDYTKIPYALDAKFAAQDVDNALRPTIIKPGKSWTKKYQESLLAKPATSTLTNAARKDERNRTYDLVDALSRSGALGFEEATFHVVIAATHCFTKSVVDTVVQDNVNPIEKVERSLLIVASTIQNQGVEQLVKAEQLERVREYNAQLF
jgi:hypothetical protein